MLTTRPQTDHYFLGEPTHLHTPEGDWNARWHRKGRDQNPSGHRSVSWWLAVAFGIGSVLFIAGGMASMSGADTPAAWMNFIGALVFSLGAVLAVIEARTAGRRLGHTHLWKAAAGPASLIQAFSAVVLFQIAMTAGVFSGLSTAQTDWWLWTPCSLGSVGFVVSGVIYLREARPAADVGTWSAAVNLAGSVCFLLGSLGGYFDEPPFNVPGNAFVNPVFMIGSICFLLGSVLSLVELRWPLLQGQLREMPANAGKQ